MIVGIHLDVQRYDKVCIFLTEVWQARYDWNIPDCLILLLLLRKKILKLFCACEGGRSRKQSKMEKWDFLGHVNHLVAEWTKSLGLILFIKESPKAWQKHSSFAPDLLEKQKPKFWLYDFSCLSNEGSNLSRIRQKEWSNLQAGFVCLARHEWTYTLTHSKQKRSILIHQAKFFQKSQKQILILSHKQQTYC